MSDIVNRLRANRDCLAPCLMDDAAAEIERLEQVVLALIAERDEARREVCYASTQPPRECAQDRGWDCFKEDGQ